MSKRECSLFLLMALFMGFIGGLLAKHVGGVSLAVAQEGAEGQPNSEKELRLPPRLISESLVLTDKDGNPRARFEITPTGEPQLVMLSRKGKVVAQFGTQSSGLPAFHLNGEDGDPRIRLALGTDGTSFFQLNAKGDLPRARLSVTDKGEPRLSLTADADNRPAATLGLDKDGTPEFQLRDFAGSGMASLYFIDHDPRLLLQDKEDKSEVTVEAIVDQPSINIYHNGVLRSRMLRNRYLLFDRLKTTRMSLQLHENGEPSINLANKKGNRLVSLSVQPLPAKEEPLVALYDNKEMLRAGLSLDEEGRPNFILRKDPLLSLVDESGKNGMYLTVDGDDRPSIYLTGLKARRELFLGIREGGQMGLDLRNGKSIPRGRFMLDKDGAPLLQMRDKNQKLILSMPSVESSKEE